MNIKEQKQNMRFLIKIAEILGVPENHLQCQMGGEQIGIIAYTNNQMKDVKYEINFLKTSLNLFHVVKHTIVKKDSSRPWSSKSTVETHLFRYMPQSGAELYDSDNNLYELNKINHFNLSLNNDLILPYQTYRELYLEYKKLKSSGTLKIVRK